MRPIYEGDEEVVSLSTRIIGRTSCEPPQDPVTGNAVVKPGRSLTKQIAAALEKIGFEQLKILLRAHL